MFWLALFEALGRLAVLRWLVCVIIRSVIIGRFGQTIDVGPAFRPDHPHGPLPCEIGQDVLQIRSVQAGVLGELGSRLITVTQGERYPLGGAQCILRGIIGGGEFYSPDLYSSGAKSQLHIEGLEPGTEVRLLVPDADPEGAGIAVVLHGLDLQDAPGPVLLEGAAKGRLALVALASLQLSLMVYDQRSYSDGA